MSLSTRKKLFGLGFMSLIATVAATSVAFMSINQNFLVAKLGIELSTAEKIADLIMAGGTIASIIGIVGAATGVGLALAGAIGALKAIAKAQGRKAVINY
ncbi:circular bacteriocin, circularin A/uberolysin family [Bacillus sp. CNPSo 3703]|uniref:circular bacteriocin, circularin A/uberolysin family n=1 Tax=Bacillus TaxID=1386 RepID=UPI00237BB6C4|nr:circular bacteriocin, circularin A/uberolysin family [Bacillus altitudinis]MDE0641096.1 circular bacteriocin, circularin A/uberolysin family [Bacillus altitudinis]